MKVIKIRFNHKGFTLIESIGALVIVSIMATMLFNFDNPYLNTARTFGWFTDGLLLQQDMERILGDYKKQRNDPNIPFDPGAFRLAVIAQYPTVDGANTGFLTFAPSGGNVFTAGAPQVNIPGGAPPVLIITVLRNGQSLSLIVT